MHNMKALWTPWFQPSVNPKVTNIYSAAWSPQWKRNVLMTRPITDVQLKTFFLIDKNDTSHDYLSVGACQ